MHLKFKTIWKALKKIEDELIQNYSNKDALLDICTYIDILQLYQILKYNQKKIKIIIFKVNIVSDND